MSASAIADALVTMLNASSAIGIGTTKKTTYELLETTASAAAIVKWRSFNSNPSSFGAPCGRRNTWNFEIKCFIRDTNDPGSATTKVWILTDKILNCIADDNTLLGTCDMVNRVYGEYDPETLFNVNGATWITFSINCEAVEL